MSEHFLILLRVLKIRNLLLSTNSQAFEAQFICHIVVRLELASCSNLISILFAAHFTRNRVKGKVLIHICLITLVTSKHVLLNHIAAPLEART